MLADVVERSSGEQSRRDSESVQQRETPTRQEFAQSLTNINKTTEDQKTKKRRLVSISQRELKNTLIW